MTSLPIHSVTSISQTFPSIRRTVFYVEETLLAIHIIAGFLNGLIHGTRYTSVQEIVLLYAVLGILVWLGFSFPNESPAWQKRAYIWLEIFCLMLTCIFTNSDLDLLLYLVLAKSCFLLNRREVILTAIATGIAWQICKVWDLADRIRIIRSTIAGYLSDPDGITISLIINNALGYLAASTFVIVLCRVILAERKSRQEAIALAQEIEILAATLERTRIARNIHDSLGHTLTSLDVQLELALRLSSQDSARSLQALNTAKNLASQALQEVRRAVSTIREKDFDLKEALGSLLQKFQQNQSFKVKKSLICLSFLYKLAINSTVSCKKD